MKTIFPLSAALLALLLAGCTAGMDLQGQDPVAYYAAHPKKNKVVSRDASVMVHFAPKAKTLASDEVVRIHYALEDISPPAVDRIDIRLAKADLHNDARKAYLVVLLRRMGYKKPVVFEPSSTLARGDVDIGVAYLAVIPPDCPDWRMSPVTSYSNTWQGNFHCAQEVNTGLMVADPHDLVRGSDREYPDSDRDAKVIEDYRAGKNFDQPPPWDTSSSGSGSAGGTGTTSGAPATTSSGQP